MNSRAVRRMFCRMTRTFSSRMAAAALCLALGSLGAAAQAACLAEYKAKRDNPLELFYNVAVISGPCTVAQARAELQARLARQGLKLLKVISVREQ